jgi:hypothetical protein
MSPAVDRNPMPLVQSMVAALGLVHAVTFPEGPATEAQRVSRSAPSRGSLPLAYFICSGID